MYIALICVKETSSLTHREKELQVLLLFMLNGTFGWFCFIAYVTHSDLTLQEFILLSCTLLLFGVNKTSPLTHQEKAIYVLLLLMLNETFGWFRFITYVAHSDLALQEFIFCVSMYL